MPDPRQRGRAYTAVTDAVASGKLPRVSTQSCAECGESAAAYHHHRGYDAGAILDVVALCARCHVRLHPKPLAPTVPNLRAIRVRRGLTVWQLSHRIGASSADRVDGYESGRYRPTRSTVQKLASALEVKPMELYDDG